MSSKSIHRIQAKDPASRQLISTLLAELQTVFIRVKTPIGEAISSVISAWRQQDDGSFLVQFSPLAAERLPALADLELLQAAKALASDSAAA